MLNTREQNDEFWLSNFKFHNKEIKQILFKNIILLGVCLPTPEQFAELQRPLPEPSLARCRGCDSLHQLPDPPGHCKAQSLQQAHTGVQVRVVRRGA